MENKKIKATMIFEAIGKPAEHLVTVLEDIAKRIGEEKGVKLVDNKVNEPVEMRENKEFFTSFSEVEVKVDEMLYIAMLMFKYMPAHIEVTSPESISVSNNDWSEILSEIARKLHGYDEVARVLGTEKRILEKKLRELMPKKEEKVESEESDEEKEK